MLATQRRSDAAAPTLAVFAIASPCRGLAPSEDVVWRCVVQGARREVRGARGTKKVAQRAARSSPKASDGQCSPKISFVEQKQVAAAHRPVRRFLSVGRRRRGHGGRSQGSTLLACRQNTSLFAIDSKQAIICVKRNGERKLDEFVETRIVGSASVYPVRLAHQRCAIRRIALGDVATFLLSLVDGLSRETDGPGLCHLEGASLGTPLVPLTYPDVSV